MDTKQINMINIHMVTSYPYNGLKTDSEMIDLLQDRGEKFLFTSVDEFCRGIEDAVKVHIDHANIFLQIYPENASITCSPFPNNNSNFSLVIK